MSFTIHVKASQLTIRDRVTLTADLSQFLGNMTPLPPFTAKLASCHNGRLEDIVYVLMAYRHAGLTWRAEMAQISGPVIVAH